MREEIMTAIEMAEYLKISPQTVRSMVRKNEIPCFRIGRRILFRKSTIDSWIATQENNIEPIETDTVIMFRDVFRERKRA